MSKIPQYAQDLTIEAILYLQSKGYKCELPELKWRINHQKYLNFKTRKITRYAKSSGTCYKTHITITQGKNRTDLKLVLLHEIAHWVNPNEHHSLKFWECAFDLYRHFKLPMRYCYNREKDYRKTAIIAYRNNRKINRNK